MTITGMITMLLIGSVVGSLGRLVIPGRQPIPIWLTIFTGVAAAFFGTLMATTLGLSRNTSGIDWLELLIQVIIAAVGVVLVANLYARRGRSTYRYGSGYRPAPETRASEWPSTRPKSSNSGASSGALPDTPRRVEASTEVRFGQSVARSQAPEFVDREQAKVRENARPRAESSAVPRSSSASEVPTRIFVSYRRMDSQYAAGRIADYLRNQFGRAEIFMDVDSLAAGVDFVDGVLNAIGRSAVVLVLIADRWVTAEDKLGRRRLADPTDNVRIEIEHALRLRVPLLPVLLSGAEMPRADELPGSLAPLPRLNAVRLEHESWEADIGTLITAVNHMRSQEGRGISQ